MSDTRACPYCAETIKAAAIKCRYCGSDLAPDPAPALPEAASPVEVHTTRRSAWPGWFLPGLAASLVVGLVFLVLALLAWLDVRSLHDAEEAGDEVRATVPAQIEALFSYSYSTFDDDQAAAQEALTADFRRRYEGEVATLRESALRDKLSQNADVVAVSVVSQAADRVQALLFVNTDTSEEGKPGARVMQNRINVDLVRSGDDGWLIDGITFPG